MTARRTGYALVAGAAIGWGMWPFVLKRASMAPQLSSAILMIVMTIATVPFFLRDRSAVKAAPRHWGGIVWLAVADSANVGLFFAAYQRTTVAIAVLTHYLAPIFVALGEPFFLGERLRGRTMLAVGVAFVGLVLLLEPWGHHVSADDLMGAALGAGSAFFYASQVLVNKRLTHVFSGSELMFFHGVLAIPMLCVFVPAGALLATPPEALATVAAASIVLGAFCGLMFVWGLRRVAASHASILTLLEPFVAVIGAVLVLRQRIGPIPLGGGVLILLGAVLVVTARLEPR